MCTLVAGASVAYAIWCHSREHAAPPSASECSGGKVSIDTHTIENEVSAKRVVTQGDLPFDTLFRQQYKDETEEQFRAPKPKPSNIPAQVISYNLESNYTRDVGMAVIVPGRDAAAKVPEPTVSEGGLYFQAPEAYLDAVEKLRARQKHHNSNT